MPSSSIDVRMGFAGTPPHFRDASDGFKQKVKICNVERNLISFGINPAVHADTTYVTVVEQ
jgi:hypothetical protein